MAVLMAERIERPSSLFGDEMERGPAAGDARRQRDRDDGLSGGPTLDDAIVGLWEGLAARATVACPLCGGPLRPHAAAGEAGGGRCADCGTTLD